MPTLEQLLEDAIGPVTPGFGLDDVIADGRRLRLRRRVLAGSAAACCFVLATVAGLAAFQGSGETSLETRGFVDQPTDVEVAPNADAEPDPALSPPNAELAPTAIGPPEPWFVRTDEVAASTFRLPTFFDGPAVIHAETPAHQWLGPNYPYAPDLAIHGWRWTAPDGAQRLFAVNLRHGSVCLWEDGDVARGLGCMDLVGSSTDDGILGTLRVSGSELVIILARSAEDRQVLVDGIAHDATAGILSLAIVPGTLPRIEVGPSLRTDVGVAEITRDGVREPFGERVACTRVPGGAYALIMHGEATMRIEAGGLGYRAVFDDVRGLAGRPDPSHAILSIEGGDSVRSVLAPAFATAGVNDYSGVGEDVGVMLEPWLDDDERSIVLNALREHPAVTAVETVGGTYPDAVTDIDPSDLSISASYTAAGVSTEVRVECRDSIIDLRPPVPLDELYRDVPASAQPGDRFGHLRIPIVNIDEPIYQGPVVRFESAGVQTAPSSSLFGDGGPLILLGFERQTGELAKMPFARPGDDVVISSRRGAQRYQVVSVEDGDASAQAGPGDVAIIMMNNDLEPTAVTTLLASPRPDS